MRKAFTLIELMISISILSIMMIFLYKSYASVNMSNKFYKKKVELIKSQQLKKKIIFLDFSLASAKSTAIINQDKNEDSIFLQSSNSMHKLYNPYVTYIVKDSKLYRLESLKAFFQHELSQGVEFSAECFGEVNSFRVYKSSEKKKEIYLIHIDFKDDENILLKVKVLNES